MLETCQGTTAAAAAPSLGGHAIPDGRYRMDAAARQQVVDGLKSNDKQS
jgi:hypothetical protein